MWQTSHGDRVLEGAEAIAFMEAVGYLRDMVLTSIETNVSYQTGVGLFDSLQPTQQLVALHQVVTGLIEPDVEAPELSAILEATVYAVYHELFCLVQIEIDCCQMDDEFCSMLRSKVLAACRAPIETEGSWTLEFEPPNDLPAHDCDQYEPWREVTEQLANRVLWDRDFELESLIADKDPVETAAIKEYLGISPDYFAIAAPDVLSTEFCRIDRELVNIRNRFDSVPRE